MKFSLADRFTLTEGKIAMSGVQALVRLPLDQHRADKIAGLNTATLVSGYRGSPVGTIDLHFQQQQRLMDAHQVLFLPAVNEELGATAVWGSQLANLYPNPKYDGVLGMWYGKGPGVDRSGDALKHGNFSGVGKNGGVLTVAGDDPTSKSSTVPSHSEIALYEAQMPILYPGNIQEVLELGRFGFELSRYCGAWVGFKIVTNIADGYGTVNLHPITNIVRPAFEYDGKPWQPNQTVRLIAPFILETEREMIEGRLEAAALFGVENNLNKTTVSSADDWIGIVAAGKSYFDVREALQLLGFDDERLNRAGVRLLKIGMLYPLDKRQIRRFSQGLQEIFVIEEKRGFIESQIRDILFNLAQRPLLVGKRDEQDRFLVRGNAELDADQITNLLIQRLSQKLDIQHPAQKQVKVTGSPLPIPLQMEQPILNRTPYYCSGCPHNRSTTSLPDGSLFGAGIGCHGMAMIMNPNVTGITQMGGEGVQWVGAAPFSHIEHLFQNLGDGTLFHSGHLAIRQAVAANTTITYKILYNDVVAMTGGQTADGGMGVPELTRSLHAEGVAKIIVCTHDLDKYPPNTQWAPDIDIWIRERLDEAQEILRDCEGVTVLIYDQPCAADLRRKRKRGLVETPLQHVFINEAVCEGCGDCGIKSNCLSVQPIETEFGRKTTIHRSSCNQDFTCLEGDCPAFVTIEGEVAPSTKKKFRPTLVIENDLLPEPRKRPLHSGNIYMMGIGGTGVVTINQILATAALLAGKEATSLDQTGLSQKAGAVISHLKISDRPLNCSNIISKESADAYLAFDILSGASAKNLTKANPKRAVAIVSKTETPTGSMIRSINATFPKIDRLRQQIDTATNAAENIYLDATRLAETLFGSHLAANMIVIGAAFQAGILPLTAKAIESAIEINAVAVQMNQLAFRLGRKIVAEPDWEPLAEISVEKSRKVHLKLDDSTQALIDSIKAEGELLRLLEIRVPELIAYQNEAYAQVYVDFVAKVKERDLGNGRFTQAVARYLFKLMAYKDEYEVARLYLRPQFQDAVTHQFGANGKMKYQLHPPLLKAIGFNKKISFGGWFKIGFKLLHKLKWVRGTPFDIFGYTELRRLERTLIDEYRTLIEKSLTNLSTQNYEQVVTLAELPDTIRGYEDVKLRNITLFREQVEKLS